MAALTAAEISQSARAFLAAAAVAPEVLALRPDYRVLVVAAEGLEPGPPDQVGDGRWLGGSDRQLRALMLSPFTRQTLTTLICSENTQDLQALTELIESAQVRPDIDRTYPLSQAPEAIQYLRDGHAQGKVVVNL